jgi:hypothetical protein
MRKMVPLFLCLGILGGLLYWPTQKPLIARANIEKIEEKAIEEILGKCAEYCEKLKSSALHFVCEEKIKEEIVLKPRIESSRLRAPTVKERNEYVYDYQLIKKGKDIKENRTLIEENGEKRNIKDALLKTKRFYSLKSVFGPVGFLGKEFQGLYNYQLKKEGKVKGRKAYIIEVIPKKKIEDKPNYGKLWVDKENFSVLKTEISQESLAGYEDFEKKAKNLRIKPILKTTHYYEVEKKGIRFPSKTVFVESYISAAKRRERSRTVIEYDNYRFFIVDYEVKYK